LISIDFSNILSKKTLKGGKFLATSKSKHKRKRHQFHLREKRRGKKRKAVLKAAVPQPPPPQSWSSSCLFSCRSWWANPVTRLPE